ncbi:hypothetical protein RhiirA5_445778 [Rhizophagus irregularis]|uniref:Uncharacterized protein n=1 Tax=Rhizophagus irregularis TaxID=588596 RepID=A0A2N0NC62_9GLOM|nr:hypothetical protein RhiirA5_445778 [Rhizophagus irregularis]
MTPVEMHKYNNVNASCSKRLTSGKKSIYPFVLSNTNPFVISSSEGEEIKESKKQSMGKQGERSEPEKEESDSEEWTVSVNKKRGGKPDSYSKGRGVDVDMSKSSFVIFLFLFKELNKQIVTNTYLHMMHPIPLLDTPNNKVFV